MRTRVMTACVAVCLLVCWAVGDVQALPVSPFKSYTTMPDNSQHAADYTPAPAHGAHWGSMMCGPTSAKNSMVWLSGVAGYQKYGVDRLTKKKVGDAWVAMSHAEIIEELAKKMVPGWDWDNDNFPGVYDDQFVTGKKAYAEARGVKLDIKWMKNTTLGLSWGTETLGNPTWEWIRNEIDADEDVEMSTSAHWVTVSGYMAEKFDDANGNGVWDTGETFYDENELGLGLGTAGVYDYFLRYSDPDDGYTGAMWGLATTTGGVLTVGGVGVIETAVSESPVPEPLTVAGLLMGLASVARYLGWRRRNVPRTQ